MIIIRIVTKIVVKIVDQLVIPSIIIIVRGEIDISDGHNQGPLRIYQLLQ